MTTSILSCGSQAVTGVFEHQIHTKYDFKNRYLMHYLFQMILSVVMSKKPVYLMKTLTCKMRLKRYFESRDLCVAVLPALTSTFCTCSCLQNTRFSKSEYKIICTLLPLSIITHSISFK